MLLFLFFNLHCEVMNHLWHKLQKEQFLPWDMQSSGQGRTIFLEARTTLFSLSHSQGKVTTCIVLSPRFHPPYDVSLHLLNKRITNSGQSWAFLKSFKDSSRRQSKWSQHQASQAPESRTEKIQNYSEEMLNSMLIYFAVLITVYPMCCRKQRHSHLSCISLAFSPKSSSPAPAITVLILQDQI